MSSGKVFKAAFESITVELPFDAKWSNGTGYFDGAVDLPLEPGKLAKSRDPYGRRLIFVGTRFGVVVVFDRFSKQDDGGVYVTNSPLGKGDAVFDLVISHTSVGEYEMSSILGAWGHEDYNLGARIELAAKCFEK